MLVSLHHVSRYRYDRPVTLSPHVVRLRPAAHCRTTIVSYSLNVRPAQHFVNWQQDPFGNYQARLVFSKPTDLLEVEVDLVAELTVVNPFDFFLETGTEVLPWRYPPALHHELEPYLDTLPLGPLLAQQVEHARSKFARPGRRTIDVLVDINARVHDLLRYDIRMEPGVLTPEKTLAGGHGSCRDFAWLLCQLLRHLGFATRFASGYSIQLTPDVKPLDGPAGVTADVTDLHAWTEVFLPGAGWVGLDATSGLFSGEGHIPLACTPDPESAAPVSGSYAWDPSSEEDRVKESFDVSMSVRRLREEPRVTKPYTDEDWARIDDLGQRVDARLRADDVRLSMGGEPTFVSIDDPDGAEWNIAAVGTNKSRLADALARRLLKRFAPGGVLHHGQGKWYPGESLPRWAIGCHWRTDGVPIWRDPELLVSDSADDDHKRDRPGDSRNGAEAAAAFVTELAVRLGVDPRFALPGHEDAWYHLWRERQLPVNVDPLTSDLTDGEERLRLARLLDRGLGKIVGYALPLARAEDAAGAWRSGPWFLRRQHLFLLPGDSPMGFRLPLDGLPWVAPADKVESVPLDPLAKREPLPKPPVARAPVLSPSAPLAAARIPSPPRPGQSAPGTPDTALCVEARNGKLHVFLPPQTRVEAYLELVAAVEDTARALGTPVRLEGYTPPSDHRLRKFEVTPDPGVIEVNIHPALSWEELRDNTINLYEDARQTRLGTEKFNLDGRHSGTGGGNHVVLGGPTPRDSPLLRRPDLLRSLVGYWNNHPSLSYLFSGMFVGPTSQAPRVDEARADSLGELEIAFRQIKSGVEAPPWLVDRLFRHLLVDVTGNTHRTEFCIDKLYSPDAASGRQGLLELRAFEMPPHARMSLTQQLLLRAMVAWFWRAPFERRLVRWGTALHDRFMLPHFVNDDFDEVLHDLGAAGFTFEPQWFASHKEFRFPRLGALSVRGIDVELRQAIEPWHVLGEQPAAGATARYVDASLERVQVKVRNLTDGRHVIACNKRRVPLHPTGTAGEYVAGVRFRAWQPPEALHPTIGVHAPLVFDVFDTWNGRSVGGFTYHVSHPGGLSFDARPRNALEAESRRAVLFVPMGHTPGASTPAAEAPNPLFPLTLDLRT
ncbi:MAG: transglutaminase family protein [Bacteroidota bacterium]